MFVAAHICFDRQIASRRRSKESKCSIQGGLCHLSRKLTAITGIGFLIPTSLEPCLPLQRSCLAPTAPAASQSATAACTVSPGARHSCQQCHSLLPPPAAAETLRNMRFISHQAHQNKATLILQVTRIQYAAFVVCTERKAAAKHSPRLQSGEMAQAFLLCVGHPTTKQPAVTARGCGDGGLWLSSAWTTAYPG